VRAGARRKGNGRHGQMSTTESMIVQAVIAALVLVLLLFGCPDC